MPEKTHHPLPIYSEYLLYGYDSTGALIDCCVGIILVQVMNYTSLLIILHYLSSWGIYFLQSVSGGPDV